MPHGNKDYVNPLAFGGGGSAINDVLIHNVGKSWFSAGKDCKILNLVLTQIFSQLYQASQYPSLINGCCASWLTGLL